MGGRELATQILPRGSHATSTTLYPCPLAQGPRMAHSCSSISQILNKAYTTSATINMGTPGQKNLLFVLQQLLKLASNTADHFFLVWLFVQVMPIARD